MSNANRIALHRLADEFGILPSYTDLAGVRRDTSDTTRIALLAAMGVDGSTDRAAAEVLDRLDRSRTARLASPVSLLDTETADLRIRLPSGIRGRLDWNVEVITENGDRLCSDGAAIVRERQQSLTVDLPSGLGAGYHAAHIDLSAKGATGTGETLLVVSPGTCTPLRDVIGDDRVFGVTANLYTIRSRNNWGVGDLTDLADLGRWIGREGGAFAGINPLHALRNADGHISPYSPVSRLFRNPVYLDVTAVPEYEACGVGRARANAAGNPARRSWRARPPRLRKPSRDCPRCAPPTASTTIA
jgi:hypothetical protein